MTVWTWTAFSQTYKTNRGAFTVTGDERGGLVVSRGTSDYVALKLPWIVSHARSGKAVVRAYASRELARAAAERLLVSGDWCRTEKQLYADRSTRAAWRSEMTVSDKRSRRP